MFLDATIQPLVIYRLKAFFSLHYRSYVKTLHQAAKNPSTIQRTLERPFSPSKRTGGALEDL